MSPVVAWAIVAGIGLGLGLWSAASILPRMSRPRLARRVAPYLVDLSASAREAISPPPPGPLPVLAILVEPAASRARAILESVLGGSGTIAKRLRQSATPMTLEAFRARQLVWGLAGAAAGVIVAGLTAVLQHVPAALQVGIVVVLTVGGVVGRDYVLQRAARRRLARLADELPVVLEFLTLSLSAGEGVLDGIRRVARVGKGELSGELAAVAAAVSTGLPFSDTLTAVAHDLDLPALSRCVDQLTSALERGTPLAEVLRAQALDAREEAKRELLEVAGRKEVGMLVPLVFLILPVTVAFAIFPGVFVLQLGL